MQKHYILVALILVLLFIPIASAMPGVGVSNAQVNVIVNGTIDVNDTITLPYGTPAFVNNVGAGTSVLLDFGIPEGSPGNGTAGTIAVNNTVTLSAGSPATVTNVGTPAVVLLNFGIPQGIQGVPGAAGYTPVFGVDYFNGTNGTNGINGTNGTSASITVNYTFTGIAGSSANVTNVGNSTAASFDFTIPIGATGAQGAKGDSGGSGTTLWMSNGTAADPITYKNLLTSPSGSAEVENTGTIKSGDGKVLLVSYITQVGYPIATELPAGLWTFNGFWYVSKVSAGKSTTVVYDVYNRTGSGTETLLFSVTSAQITALSVSTLTTYYTQSTSYFVSPTDRIVVKVSIQSTEGGAGITYHRFSDGTTHAANVVVPLSTTQANRLLIGAKSSTSALYKGQAIYISGASGGIPIIDKANNTVTAKTRVSGLVQNDVAASTNVNYVRAGELASVDTRSTNTNINPLGQTWVAGDLLFATTGGGLTNVRPTSGRSVKAAYTMLGSNQYDTLLAYPMENPIWSTAAATEDVVLRLGDSAGTNKVSIRNYTNTEVAYFDSNGNLSMLNHYITSLISGSSGSSVVNKTYVDTKANLTQYSYVTLMAGSAMYPKTNPPLDFDQLETATNKNNVIYANISSAGTPQNVQWLVDMPADWDNGNIIAQFKWTVQSGSGDVNWTLSGVRLTDNVALDTATPLIAYKVDTVQTANYLHVSDATTAAAVTGTGNMILFKVGRSTTSETCTVPAQLMAVKIKYAKVIGAA